MNRRAFLAGGGVGGLLLSGMACADTLFTQFPFAATGEPTARTMPDRLAEIKNVLDFGANPTGAADSQPAIQATVNAVISAGGGTVYFPLGFYSVHSPITFNASGISIYFRGEGIGSTIAANFNGFVFDRHLGSPSNTASVVFAKMAVENSDQTPGGGSGGVRLGSCLGISLRDSSMSGFIGMTTEDSAGNSSQNILIENCKFQSSTGATGSTGLIVGGCGALLGSDFIGSDIGMALYGGGFYVAGCRNENCTTAYQLGLDSAGNNIGLSGFSFTSCSNEGFVTGIDMAGTCSAGYISVDFLGHPGSGPGQNVPTQYGLRVRADCAKGCVFSVRPQSYFDVAGISIANASARANNVFLGSTSVIGSGSGVPWIVPTNAYTAQFIECNVQPIWTFAGLPTGGDVLEGDQFNISDANSTAWGTNVTGSSANHHVLVRWNGSNWTVVGV